MELNTLNISKSNLAKRKAINILMLSLCIVSALIAIVPLFYIFFYTATAGLSSINLDFLTQLPKPVGEAGGGMANAIVGSMIIIGIGSLFGIPIVYYPEFMWLNILKHFFQI